MATGTLTKAELHCVDSSIGKSSVDEGFNTYNALVTGLALGAVGSNWKHISVEP